MKVNLMKKIDLKVQEVTYKLDEGQLIEVDIEKGIAFHEETGFGFDIEKNEYCFIV